MFGWRFVTVRDLRLKSAEIWRKLRKENDLVITSNGKPVAVISGIKDDQLEEYMKALRSARATLALDRIQDQSRRKGLATLSEGEIEAEIQAVRRSRPRCANGCETGQQRNVERVAVARVRVPVFF